VFHVSASILTSTKKILGIEETDTSFDLDILTHINSVFSTLNQLGIGPEQGFAIEDATPTWDAFLGTDPRLNQVKSYVYLRLRLIFDPPTSSYAITAMEKQVASERLP
jgi:type II secretory pathway component HofQ